MVTINAAAFTRGKAAVRITVDNTETTISREDFLSHTRRKRRSTVLCCDCNRYSFDSWLRVFISILCRREPALLIHSAGAVLNGHAHLFYGVSGAGKSTITRIIGKDRALSDELVLVYRALKTWRAVSTPFWGELKKNNGTVFDAPLAGIHRLEKSPTATVRRSAPIAALPALLACIMHFDKSPGSVTSILSTAEGLLRSVPPDTLSFSRTTTPQELAMLLDNKKRRS